MSESDRNPVIMQDDSQSDVTQSAEVNVHTDVDAENMSAIPTEENVLSQEAESTEHLSDAQSDQALFEQYIEQDLDFDLPGIGDLRQGTIVEIRSSEILVNIGSKRDGVITQTDLSKLDNDYVKSLEVGQDVDIVIGGRQNDDVFTLSISEAKKRRDWTLAHELLESGDHTTHKAIGYNKGGLTVEFNSIRGFVPASHLLNMPRQASEKDRLAELARRVNDEMRLKVIEVDEERRRLVLSHTEAEREHRDVLRKELLQNLSVGDVIEGTVRSMRPFGAFVDIGGVDGLLHVSEITWSPVKHPRDVLQIGDEIDVKVIRLDSNNQRIALSRRQLLPNPWDDIENRYKAGQRTTAVITRVVDFGAFAELEAGVEGLIHISELADITIAEPLKTVQVGEEVDVKVLRVDPKRRRVGLSLRQTQETQADADTLDEGINLILDDEGTGEIDSDLDAAISQVAESI